MEQWACPCVVSRSRRLDGRRQWGQRVCRWLARAPEAVAERPVGLASALGVTGRPGPPGALRERRNRPWALPRPTDDVAPPPAIRLRLIASCAVACKEGRV